MAAIKAFGAYLPSRIVTNAELGARLGCEPGWILDVSGIEERRYAAPGDSVGDAESVASMGVAAARDCLDRAGVKAAEVGMILVSSGSSERRFPGPASSIAHALGHERHPGNRSAYGQRGQLIRHGAGVIAGRDPRQCLSNRVRENVAYRDA